MLTSKDRAKLKNIISKESPVCIIGKEGLSETCMSGINDALIAREIVKISVLTTCDKEAKTLANEIEETLKCEVVDVIGKKIIVYKLNNKKKIHVL